MGAEKLRVAHIITQLELGGAQRNTLYTLAHLDRNRFEPSLLCGPGGILDEETQGGNWPTTFIPTMVRPIRPIKDLIAFCWLYKYLRHLKPHIVHTHSSKAGILGRLAAYFAGVPVIIHTFHGFGFTPGQSPRVRNFYIHLERWCAVLSTHLIYVSEANRKEAADLGIGTQKPSSLIRSGIALKAAQESTIRQELGIPKEAWVVTSVGNFKPQKNPMDLAKVAEQVLAEDRSIHFLLAGDGELRKIVETYVTALEITSNIHFLGWRQDVAQILAGSDCFVLTSLWEGLPRALVEAYAAGLPAVAYAVDGVQDILQDDTGFSVQPGDTAFAAQKILWLKQHPEEARRMGREGGKRIAAEFDIDLMVRKQQELYETTWAAVPMKEEYQTRWTTA